MGNLLASIHQFNTQSHISIIKSTSTNPSNTSQQQIIPKFQSSVPTCPFNQFAWVSKSGRLPPRRRQRHRAQILLHKQPRQALRAPRAANRPHEHLRRRNEASTNGRSGQRTNAFAYHQHILPITLGSRLSTTSHNPVPPMVFLHDPNRWEPTQPPPKPPSRSSYSCFNGLDCRDARGQGAELTAHC
ncbi:hypothetical protein IQ06DRAFT_154662 [Phaeosphaeriaceae sp. SRC1lsM3a]|nr:hypothetical protein IQ06DRAFT_154662 [Stagonospora sp. SRC1lsM3a]